MKKIEQQYNPTPWEIENSKQYTDREWIELCKDPKRYEVLTSIRIRKLKKLLKIQ